MYALENMENMSEKGIKTYLMEDWEAPRAEVDKYKILVAYVSVGSWGRDSAAYFLLEEKVSGKLFEVSGYHCSCNGFEGQFYPMETHPNIIMKDSFPIGGYSDIREEELKGYTEKALKAWKRRRQN